LREKYAYISDRKAHPYATESFDEFEWDEPRVMMNLRAYFPSPE